MVKINFYLYVFCVFFIILKVFSVFSTNFDLFGDEAQYWVWSKSLDLGYFSKPPLLAWIIAAFSFLFGDSFEVLKFLPVLMYVLTSCAVYLLYKKLYKDKTESTL